MSVGIDRGSKKLEAQKRLVERSRSFEVGRPASRGNLQQVSEWPHVGWLAREAKEHGASWRRNTQFSSFIQLFKATEANRPFRQWLSSSMAYANNCHHRKQLGFRGFLSLVALTKVLFWYMFLSHSQMSIFLLAVLAQT